MIFFFLSLSHYFAMIIGNNLQLYRAWVELLIIFVYYTICSSQRRRGPVINYGNFQVFYSRFLRFYYNIDYVGNWTIFHP